MGLEVHQDVVKNAISLSPHKCSGLNMIHVISTWWSSWKEDSTLPGTYYTLHWSVHLWPLSPLPHFDTNMAWIFDGIFVFNTIRVYI